MMTLSEQVDLAQLLSNAGAPCISINLDEDYAIMIDFSNPQEVSELNKTLNLNESTSELVANWNYGRDQIELTVESNGYYIITKPCRGGLWSDLGNIDEEFLLPQLKPLLTDDHKMVVKALLRYEGGVTKKNCIVTELVNSIGNEFILTVFGFDNDDELSWNIVEIVEKGTKGYLFDTLYHYGLEIRDIKYCFVE